MSLEGSREVYPAARNAKYREAETRIRCRKNHRPAPPPAHSFWLLDLGDLGDNLFANCPRSRLVSHLFGELAALLVGQDVAKVVDAPSTCLLLAVRPHFGMRRGVSIMCSSHTASGRWAQWLHFACSPLWAGECPRLATESRECSQVASMARVSWGPKQTTTAIAESAEQEVDVLK